ncbi:MAG: helix-turn-helix domain-containing protein [Phascolarctobacterium sp.]|nr:helix-turn-helix domain-containing protein [Phascolarctobacterium sp.]
MADSLEVPMIETENREETMGDRMRIVRSYLKLNQKEFAEKLGIYPSRVSEMEKGAMQVPANVIMQIGKLGFDLNWFVLGHTKNDDVIKLVDDNVALFKIVNDLKKMDGRDLKFITDVISSFKKNYHK